MNNKRLGTAFEQEMCVLLAEHGFWVHFIVPDARGAQPFDIIAVRNGEAFAIDCKTSSRKSIPISRLEDNQIMAFEKWISCGNSMPIVAVKYNDDIYLVPYAELKEEQTVKLTEDKKVCMCDEKIQCYIWLDCDGCNNSSCRHNKRYVL